MGQLGYEQRGASSKGCGGFLELIFCSLTKAEQSPFSCLDLEYVLLPLTSRMLSSVNGYLRHNCVILSGPLSHMLFLLNSTF